MDEFKDIKSKINLRDIKSSYITQKIFSFLSVKQKLDMILYNKEYQKICLIDFDDYKKIAWKYKIIGKNGKGIEYIINTNMLIFEGEYLKGRRNGKGKEYNKKGKLKFEGEYLNGKKNGKGKEYIYNNGKLIFEGEYLNGKKWNGKGYDINGDLAFEIKGGKGNRIFKWRKKWKRKRILL